MAIQIFYDGKAGERVAPVAFPLLGGVYLTLSSQGVTKALEHVKLSGPSFTFKSTFPVITPLPTPSGESAPLSLPSSLVPLTPPLTLSSNGTSMNRNPPTQASHVPGYCWLSRTHQEISPVGNGPDVPVVPVVSEEEDAVQGITGLDQDPEVSGPRKRTTILEMVRKFFPHELRVGVHE